VATVADFLRREIGPALSDPRLRFRNLIAANVLTIVARELAGGDALERAAWRRLSDMFEGKRSEMPARPDELRAAVDRLSRELCATIRAGKADEGPAFDAAYAAAYAGVVDKLTINNPKFLDRVLKEHQGST
jgi:hypothetical protein